MRQLYDRYPPPSRFSVVIDLLNMFRVMAASQLHKKDEALSDRIASLQFLWPCHLGIPSGYEDSPQWDTAQERTCTMFYFFAALIISLSLLV